MSRCSRGHLQQLRGLRSAVASVAAAEGWRADPSLTVVLTAGIFKYTFDYLIMPAEPRPASLKSAIYEQIARIGQATSSPNRLELLDLLSQGARTVDAPVSSRPTRLACT
jgi:hypothetical protein